jgi:hypothetical protein
MEEAMNRKVLVALALIVGSLAVTTPVSAGTLVLVGATGGVITDGDKAFSNFTCSIAHKSGVAIPTDCGSITVQAFTDVLGNFGIEYQATFLASTSATTSNVDILLGYDVTDLSGQTMTDAHLGFDGHTTQVVGNPFLLADINETINELSPTPTLSLATLHVSAPPPVLNDAVTFAGGPITSARVSKDVSLTATGEVANSGTVLFSTITQTWSESNAVPEPGSIFLLGTALIGCVTLVRRRVSRKA